MTDLRWYIKAGFKENPFSIKPGFFNNKLFGLDMVVNELAYRIDSGTMSFLEGDFGTGKTSVLKAIIERYKGKKQVIYFAANRIDRKLDIEELLQGRYGAWGRLFNRKPKNMILLLDECQGLSKVNSERVKNYFDHNYIKSVVFTGTNFRSVKFHPSIISRIGIQGVVRIPKLTYDDAIHLVRNRIGESQLLTDDIIKRLFMLGDYNSRRLLHFCDAVCRNAVEKNRESVTLKDLEEVLKKKQR